MEFEGTFYHVIFRGNQRQKIFRDDRDQLYPVPQNAPYVRAGMNVPNIPEGQRPKATDVSPWNGVYYRSESTTASARVISGFRNYSLTG